MKVPAIVREVYGRRLIYIKDSPEIARAVKKLTGKTTIDEEDIKALSVLGVDIEVTNPYED